MPRMTKDQYDLAMQALEQAERSLEEALAAKREARGLRVRLARMEKERDHWRGMYSLCLRDRYSNNPNGRFRDELPADGGVGEEGFEGEADSGDASSD